MPQRTTSSNQQRRGYPAAVFVGIASLIIGCGGAGANDPAPPTTAGTTASAGSTATSGAGTGATATAGTTSTAGTSGLAIQSLYVLNNLSGVNVEALNAKTAQVMSKCSVTIPANGRMSASADGSLYTRTSSNTLIKYDYATGAVKWTSPKTKGGLHDLAVLPNGNVLVAQGFGFDILDKSDGLPIATNMADHWYDLYQIAYDPADGAIFAVGSRFVAGPMWINFVMRFQLSGNVVTYVGDIIQGNSFTAAAPRYRSLAITRTPGGTRVLAVCDGYAHSVRRFSDTGTPLGNDFGLGTDNALRMVTVKNVDTSGDQMLYCLLGRSIRKLLVGNTDLQPKDSAAAPFYKPNSSSYTLGDLDAKN